MGLNRPAAVGKVKCDPPIVQHVKPLHHSDPHYRFNLLVRAMQQKLRTSIGYLMLYIEITLNRHLIMIQAEDVVSKH